MSISNFFQPPFISSFTLTGSPLLNWKWSFEIELNELHLAVLKSGAGLQFHCEKRDERRYRTRHVGYVKREEVSGTRIKTV